MKDLKLLAVVKDSLLIGMFWSIFFVVVLILLLKKLLQQSEGFRAFGGLKYNLLVETDIRCLL